MDLEALKLRSTHTVSSPDARDAFKDAQTARLSTVSEFCETLTGSTRHFSDRKQKHPPSRTRSWSRRLMQQSGTWRWSESCPSSK